MQSESHIAAEIIHAAARGENISFPQGCRAKATLLLEFGILFCVDSFAMMNLFRFFY